MKLNLHIVGGADTLRQVVAEYLKQANPSAALRVIALGFADASESVCVDSDTRRVCAEITYQLNQEADVRLALEEANDDSQLPHS